MEITTQLTTSAGHRCYWLEADRKVKDTLGPALLRAIRDGREMLAIELAESAADLNAKDSYGFALTQAIRAGFVKLARKLLESGANPNVMDSYGFALTQAIRRGFEALAIELVERGAATTCCSREAWSSGQAAPQYVHFDAAVVAWPDRKPRVCVKA
jgi:hypothetical protein